jgi:hypothetical protein
MRRKSGIGGSEGPHAIRVAWWASFLATVVLLALLGVARSAQALTPPKTAGPTAAGVSLPAGESEAEEEGEEGEAEGEECEAEEAEEEFEAEECEAEAGAAEAPRQCVLSSAVATVSASTVSDKVRLTIRYTAFAPGSVQVVAWSRGTKGPLSLNRESDHLSGKGVLRETENLTEAQMSKAAAAKSFTVQLRPAHAPRYCHSLLDRHLTIRHSAAGRLTWSDPELGYRSSRRP